MMANDDQRETKLAPIFETKTNKDNGKPEDSDGNNRRKRKKKSNKSDVKNKTIKKSVTNCPENDLNEPIACRRSGRLRSKETDNKVKVKYNEDTDEEEVVSDEQCLPIEKVDNKVIEPVIPLAEDSNTVGYWTDNNSENCLFVSSEEEVEILSSVKGKDTIASEDTFEVIQQSITSQTEEPKECLLWTEKYKPTNSSGIVGQSVATNRLKSWLEDWGKTDPKIPLKYEDDSEDDCSDETNSCLLICGPTGSGKTSMVYAIAEQLKYEVLELNASMKRNGKVISKILSEATQSHQMQRNIESNGSTPSIHSFFSSVANNSVDNDLKIDKIVKNNTKSKPKPKGILNYFSKQTQNSSKTFEIEIIDNKCEEKTEKQSKTNSVVVLIDRTSNDCPLFAPKALSIATKSLILFDDIDVMIDEDLNGFWSAFNRINETTKKPVVLTATQSVSYIENCVNRLQVLTLNKPNSSETIECLKNICDKELDDYESDDKQTVCKYLSDTYDNDIRRCLNELQFGTVWENINQKDRQTEQMSETKFDFNSYYDSLLFADVMQNSFGIFSYSQNRNNWMNCKPNVIENDSQTISLAKDIFQTINELNSKLNKKSVELCPSKELSKPIDSESIDSISRYLSPNINLKTILLDYCPHLSLICESETIRQSLLANHSRRSRRFMHHLDSIGFSIDNLVKTKLISAFIPIGTLDISEKISEELVSVKQIDDYFYD